jgi:putative serine protease PepD
MPMQGWAMFVGGAVLALASSAPLAGARVTARTEAPPEAKTLSRAFANVARAIGPSVVRIEVTGASEQATASGVILDTRGNVVTSSHALDGGEPQSIAVVLVDGRRFGAEIIGRDAATDVAVLKVLAPPRDLSAARFGDSDGTDVGEWVLAVGSPLGLEQTITAGIISGRAHVGASQATPGQAYLQTDAKVNPGNSGGPLVNLEGEVVGLSALISAGPGGSYGYAIPINRVRRTAAMLIRDGHAQHPYIGVALRDVRDLDSVERVRWGERLPARGALVSRIMRDAPAARAGLRAGDVITSVNDREIPAATELADLVATQEVGTRLLVGFIRGGAARRVPLSVADLPATSRETLVEGL